MKKTLLSLATLLTAGLLSMAADCTGSNVEACTADADCETAGDICDLTDPDAGVCIAAECTAGEDCALSAATTEFVCPIGKGGAGCAEDFAACNPDGAVEVVDSLGTSYCGVEEDAANDFACVADANGVAITVEAAAGGTVTICVDAAGSCDAGVCG